MLIIRSQTIFGHFVKYELLAGLCSVGEDGEVILTFWSKKPLSGFHGNLK